MIQPSLVQVLQELKNLSPLTSQGAHPTVCVTDCHFVVNALDLPFTSPITIYR